MSKGNEPAYPAYMPSHPDNASGFTKREVIAKDLMASIVGREDSPAPDWQKCAEDAVKAADALLEALG